MDFNSEFWWLGLRACLYCGSGFPHSDGLCNSCSQELWAWSPEAELYYQTIHHHEVGSLFQWIPGKQEVLSCLVLAMKGHHAGRLWSVYAEAFWRKYQVSQEVCYKQVVVIPSPASVSHSMDHARLFSEALAKIAGAKLLPCLRRANSNTAQKNKSRRARARVELEWDEKFSAIEFGKLTAGKRILFVDDVVTTGATGQAAWKILGCPEDFSICSLAQRSLSCGASGDLV